MRNLRRLFLEQVALWDAPTKIALTIATVLIAVMFGVYAFGGEALRIPAVVGLATLFLVAQGIVLWGNRRMVTPFTQAQQLYLRGDIDGARDVLIARRSTDSADVQELTLLGNIYRQLGELDNSAGVLHEALGLSPQHHFPLYGLGRTKLAQGDYDGAVEHIRQAINTGAPPIVWADLAEALYRTGETDATMVAMTRADRSRLEPYRTLMMDYIRYRLGEGNLLDDATIAAGLPYWEEAAKRFAHTPYGKAISDDIRRIRRMDEENSV